MRSRSAVPRRAPSASAPPRTISWKRCGETDPRHHTPRELARGVGRGPLARHLRAQGRHPAPDVVADRAHGQGTGGRDDAAHRHAVAVVRVRCEHDVEHAREAPRVADLLAEALLQLGEESLGHEQANLAALDRESIEAGGIASGRALPAQAVLPQMVRSPRRWPCAVCRFPHERVVENLRRHGLWLPLSGR
jgi:hypothetical protein